MDLTVTVNWPRVKFQGLVSGTKTFYTNSASPWDSEVNRSSGRNVGSVGGQTHAKKSD